MSSVSKPLAVPPDKFSPVLATPPAAAATRLGLIEVPVDVPLEGGLRAKSIAASIDDTPKGFVAAVREDVSFEPSPRAGRSSLDFTAQPVAHEVVASRLRVDVGSL